MASMLPESAATLAAASGTAGAKTLAKSAAAYGVRKASNGGTQARYGAAFTIAPFCVKEAKCR